MGVEHERKQNPQGLVPTEVYKMTQQSIIVPTRRLCDLFEEGIGDLANYIPPKGESEPKAGHIIALRMPPSLGLILATSKPRYVGGGFVGYCPRRTDKILCYAERYETIGRGREPLYGGGDQGNNLVVTSQNFQVHASDPFGYNQLVHFWGDFEEAKRILTTNAREYLSHLSPICAELVARLGFSVETIIGCF